MGQTVDMYQGVRAQMFLRIRVCISLLYLKLGGDIKKILGRWNKDRWGDWIANELRLCALLHALEGGGLKAGISKLC